jgi:hypothetical protein
MPRKAHTARKTIQHCCERMAFDLDRKCEGHPDRFSCPDMLIHRSQDGSHGLIVHDGGTSVIGIAFCPWCGTKLPARRPGVLKL